MLLNVLIPPFLPLFWRVGALLRTGQQWWHQVDTSPTYTALGAWGPNSLPQGWFLMTPQATFVVVWIWLALGPLDLSWLGSTEHVLEFPVSLKKPLLWLHVYTGISRRQKTCHNFQPNTDIRTSQGCLTTHDLNPFSFCPFLGCHNPFIPIEGHIPQLLLPCPPSKMPLSEMQGTTNLLLFLHPCPLLGVFPTVLLCILQKLLLRHWLAEGLIPLIWT